MNIEEAKRLKKEFDDAGRQGGDFARWKWIADNQDTGIIVYLDNDDTIAYLQDDSGDDFSELPFAFHDYVGSAEGLMDMFRAFDIRADLA